MSTTWDKLVDYWKENVTKNIKKISALLGNMIINFIAIILYVVREHYAWQSALLIIVLAMQPFFYMYINIVFKGETELKDQEILVLNQKLEYQQELAQYQILIAAKDGKVPETVMNVFDWNEINRKLDELYKMMAQPKVYTNTADSDIFHSDTTTNDS